MIESTDGRQFVIIRTTSGLKLCEVLNHSMNGNASHFRGRRWRAKSKQWTRVQKILKGLIDTPEPTEENARWLARRLAEVGVSLKGGGGP